MTDAVKKDPKVNQRQLDCLLTASQSIKYESVILRQGFPSIVLFWRPHISLRTLTSFSEF